MATIKKVLLAKQISSVLYAIYPKTSADIVTYDDTYTVATKLAEVATALESVSTTENVEKLIKEADDALYNKIMGLTDENTTISEAYDTLKEVADYLAAHEDVVSGFTSDISDLKSALADLQDAVDTNTANIATNTSNIATNTSDIATLKSNVSTLQDTVAALDYSKVTASTTNGNIVVDGVEVTVYTLPDTLPASMIETDDDHQFVTAAEKATIASAIAVENVTSEAEATDENTLYLIDIE